MFKSFAKPQFEWCWPIKLREAGYRVVEASDPDEALELLQHGALDVEVIISDVQMPEPMDGIELARVI